MGAEYLYKKNAVIIWFYVSIMYEVFSMIGELMNKNMRITI